MLKIKIIRLIINDLISTLEKNKEKLFKLNEKCTLDTAYWIKEDWKYIKAYLKEFEKNNNFDFKKNIKPKGNLFIILSYNEPMILSVIPILNALIGGNKVIVKPSRKSMEIFNIIWNDSGIVRKYNLSLETVFIKKKNFIEYYIKKSNAVYFFGGHGVAKDIYKICARHFVEFYPEIETADCKVVNIKDFDNFDFKKDALLTLKESFSHSGQICHRIQGVMIIGNKNYNKYRNCLVREFNNFEKNLSLYISGKFKPNKEYLEQVKMDIENSNYKKILKYKNSLPFLIVEPDIESVFLKKAYFLPILWIIKVKSRSELISLLKRRTYHLGLNLMSDNKKVIDEIVADTNFSRYTINIAHTKINLDEGWGGNWPSGFTGYKKWLEHFTNPFDKIQN